MTVEFVWNLFRQCRLDKSISTLVVGENFHSPELDLVRNIQIFVIEKLVTNEDVWKSLLLFHEFVIVGHHGEIYNS